MRNQNNIDELIKGIALEKGDLKLARKISKEIEETLNLKRNMLWRWKNNQFQPSITQASELIKVLQRYNPDLGLDDLITQPISNSDKKINEIFS